MCGCDAFYGISKEYFAEKNCIFTSEEIAQQPKLWIDLSKMLLEKKDEISAFLNKIGGADKRRIIFTGAGSSGFIGDALAALIAKNNGIRSESIHSTDIVTDPGSYLFADVPTLLVSIARSGNSPESVGAVSYARAVCKDLFEVAIVCDDTSDLFNETAKSERSMTLVMPEGSNDKGFAMTSSVSCMLLTGFALFNAEKIDDFAKDVALLAENLSGAGLKLTEAASKWAARDFDRIAYLGCGFLKHLAHEASLKMMELTGGAVNGSYESPAGFRHGPKSVINDKTLTVHIVSNDPFTAKYDLDLLKEVMSQQGQNMIISICAENAQDALSEENIPIAADGYIVGGDICTGLQALVFCQMLAMFKSLSLGVNTDNPSPTGAVNRVVKGITVYELADKIF